MSAIACRDKLFCVTAAAQALWVVALSLVAWSVAAAQPPSTFSVLNRLSGFDEPRVADVAQWAQDPQDAERISEAAKLLFQVNRLARTSLAAPPAGSAPQDHPDLMLSTGDAVTIRGTALSLATSALPPELAEVLEFDRVYRVEVQTTYQTAADAVPVEGPRVYVLTTSIPAAWSAQWAQSQQLAERTAATGVVVQSDASARPQVLAAPSLAWFPSADARAAQDWALLGQQGFNVSLLEEVRTRNRKPLLAADSDAFYGMLKAADQLAQSQLPPPPEVDAAELLRNASALVGQRLRLRCQSVRITRVSVNNPLVRASLGSDHYWQIDALGDLGNVVIRVEPADGDAEPVVFESRYPVSIAALTLPDFLRDLIGQGTPAGAGRGDVLMHSRQLVVDGFFYRLWSYESDFMRRQGGGDQFGPLLMATQINDAEPPPGDRAGVAKIGQAAAIAALLMLAAAGLWIYFTSRRDAAARAQRRAKEHAAGWPS